MRSVSLVCLLLAIVLAIFAWWGIGTTAGRHAFDEMAGLIPFAAALLSPGFALCALMAWLIAWRRDRAEL